MPIGENVKLQSMKPIVKTTFIVNQISNVYLGDATNCKTNITLIAKKIFLISNRIRTQALKFPHKS